MTKTKPVSTADQVETQVPTPEVPSPIETTTAWKAFEAAKLMPVRVDCQAYPIAGQPWHDASCHTKLIPSPDTFRRHMAGEHGGQFQIYLRRTDGKPSPLWNSLSTSGLEASDIRCEICDERLRFHPSSFERHLRPHKGKARQTYTEMRWREPSALGQFNVTLGIRPQEDPEDSEDYTA